MSCHLSHRLTTVHRAVSMALLYSVGYAALVSSAQAATIGKTVVTSAQHEPLAASILVTDIKTTDFSASLANSTVYQQMGLTPTDSMTIRFQPTSATSGQVFITTTKPVSKPFADVILAINDGAQRNVIPKTLLMPLNDSLPITPSKNIVTGARKPNLPVVSITNAQPLTVRQGTPPPLFSSPKVSAYKSSTSDLAAAKLSARDIQASNIQAPNIQAPTVSSSLPAAVTATTQSNTTVYAPSRLNDDNAGSANSLDKSYLDKKYVNTSNNIPNNKISANNTAATSLSVLSSDTIEERAVTNKQFDILNIQIIRQIQLNNEHSTGMMAAIPMSPKTALPPTLNNQASTIQANSTNSIVANTPLNNVSTNDISSSSVASNQVAAQQAVANQPSNAEVNYTVQRNDSLWVIAQQIAEKNNLDVQTVMKEIKSQNPSAFINKNADQLKADAQLSLPNYDVLPSQKKLEAAISAQRQYNRKASIPVATTTPTSKTISKQASKSTPENTQAAKRTAKPAATKTQTLPKAQFSVIAPGHQGSADGTKTKSGMAAGNGLSTDVLSILKSSRQSTASQAQRLSKTSGTLESYTRKLQLQNHKLAELQARLEKLRN